MGNAGASWDNLPCMRRLALGAWGLCWVGLQEGCGFLHWGGVPEVSQAAGLENPSLG